MDMIEEKRENAFVQMEAYRGRMVRAYNKNVRVRGFQVGDLVLKKDQPAGEVGKLEPKWKDHTKSLRS